MVTKGAAGDAFEALGDPNRRTIVELLRRGPSSVGELADQMPISRPAVSRHLRLLREAGLVTEEAQGTRNIYRLHDEGIEAVQAYLLRVWGDPRPASACWRRTPRRDEGNQDDDRTAAVDIVLEPRVGGRIYERLDDGREIDWGEVTAWEPPVRLASLWHIRRDRADATDVELTFADGGDGTTRIEIVHSGWERLGAAADEWRDANRGGWDGLLPHFVAHVTDAHDDLEER